MYIGFTTYQKQEKIYVGSYNGSTNIAMAHIGKRRLESSPSSANDFTTKHIQVRLTVGTMLVLRPSYKQSIDNQATTSSTKAPVPPS